jgi:prepilin-type N-terminal cleavage/methylation domain-containing protein
MNRRTARKVRGFTLMELLVVIALVALLMTVMVPVVLNFMKGRGLSMMGNSISGFVAGIRSEAMNTRENHVLVFYEEETDISPEGSVIRLRVGPGIAAFRVRSDRQPDEEPVAYVRHLDFTGQIGSDVFYAARWRETAPRGPILGLPDTVNHMFRDYYTIGVQPDGRLIILDDKPGYLLDIGETNGLDTDVVLTDGTRFVFIDFNSVTGNVKRSGVIHENDTDYNN